ncbi:MAG: methyl-accepting chemotaxis protein, partial [Bacteroidales bacterium]
MNFKDLKISRKLGIGFGVLILLLLIVGGLAVINMQRVTTQSNYLANEYIPEVHLSNNIERTTQGIMLEMRGYGFTENEKFWSLGYPKFKEVYNYLDEADKLANESKKLVALKSSVQNTREALKEYDRLSVETKVLIGEIAKNRQEIEETSTIFLDNCLQYLKNQENELTSDIKNKESVAKINERYKKIKLISTIMNTANELIKANYKAQALRDPESYKKSLQAFNISYMLQEIRSITHQQVNIQQLNIIENESRKFKDAMELFLVNWIKREEYAVKRLEVSTRALTLSQETAKAGIEHTIKIVNDTQSSLSTSSAVMVIGLLLAIVIGVIFALFISRIITSPIIKGVNFAQEIANGNLTAQVDVNQKDEIGQLAKALQEMLVKLRSIINNVVAGADNIASASTQMSSTSQ